MRTTNVKTKFQNYVNNLYSNFLSVAKQVQESRKNPYEIAGWVKKESSDSDILIYRVTATDKYIASFSILDVYSDDEILMNFSKKEIKYISTLAILLHYKREPKYKIAWECFRNNLDEKIIHFEDRDNPGIIKRSIEQLESEIKLIDCLSGKDAFLLGKEIGILERIKEENHMRDCG